MTVEVLSDRELNRATLARQLLLERVSVPVVDVVSQLVGMQAQEPFDPYVALWSRLDGFQPEDLVAPLVDRELVRTTVMRGTIHLVTGDDCLGLRPLMQPVLDREIAAHRDYAPQLDGVDLGPPLEVGRELLSGRPLSGKELRAALAERVPGLDPAALAYACRCKLTLIQAPPRGVWGHGGQVRVATAESWLGRCSPPSPSLDEVALRYLAAFGPATTGDFATWSRLTGLAEVVDRLRPQLRAFQDERGRKLVDLPDAPRPDPDTPAPTRFLPVYDNVVLSHDDRSRMGDKAKVLPLYVGPPRDWGSVLHDGTVRATWRIDRDKPTGAATLFVRHLGPLPKPVSTDIAAEGERLLQFAAPEATSHDIHYADVA